MRRAALLALLLTTAPAMAAQYDVPWFEANQAARRDVLRACGNDARHTRWICRNAEAAESRAYAQRLRQRSGVLPPEFMTPMVRDAIARACAGPQAGRALVAPNCRKT